MNGFNKLRRIVLKFLRLETLAEVFYLHHLHAVPPETRGLFREFVSIEERHRRMFESYYTSIYGTPVPTFRVATFCAGIIAEALHLFGTSTIVRFECWIERRAIADYTTALEWIEEPELQKLIHRVLHDEAHHLPLTEALLTFREDEEEHIRKMTKLIQKR